MKNVVVSSNHQQLLSVIFSLHARSILISHSWSSFERYSYLTSCLQTPQCYDNNQQQLHSTSSQSLSVSSVLLKFSEILHIRHNMYHGQLHRIDICPTTSWLRIIDTCNNHHQLHILDITACFEQTEGRGDRIWFEKDQLSVQELSLSYEVNDNIFGQEYCQSRCILALKIAISF